MGISDKLKLLELLTENAQATHDIIKQQTLLLTALQERMDFIDNEIKQIKKCIA